jgi:hypothetical protein
MRKRHFDGEPEDDEEKKELATATVGSQEPRDPFPLCHSRKNKPSTRNRANPSLTGIWLKFDEPRQNLEMA